MPESQTTSPFSSKTKQPQTSIVLKQSSRPRSCYSCLLSCRCSRTQHCMYSSLPIFDLKSPNKYGGLQFLNYKIGVLVCFSFYMQILENLRPLGQLVFYKTLFLQCNKEYYNLFARSLLDHSHSYCFRNSLVSLT